MVKTNLPPVKDYPSRKEWENACWRKMLKAEELLELLITPYERRNLIMRAAVMDRLSSGKSYRQIAEELWLSPQTVSIIKKSFKESKYRSYRQRGKTERKKKVYFTASPAGKNKKHRGRPVRTKYGTLYLSD